MTVRQICGPPNRGSKANSEYPAALRVHCFAHCLNLCLQDAAKKCKPIKAALDNVMELSQLIRYSPK